MRLILVPAALLLLMAHADLSSDSSSQENSSEQMGNACCHLNNHGHVLENETTKKPQEITPDPSEDILEHILTALDPGGEPEGIVLDNSDAELSFRGDLDGMVAVAQMIYEANGAVVESGFIVFHQARPLQAVRVLGTLQLAAAPTSIKIEIHTNADTSNNCQNAGRIYNPFGVSDGGVLLRSGATIQTNYVSFFKEDRSIFQLTLYGGSKVIGKSVVVYNQDNLPVACGVTYETANMIGGATTTISPGGVGVDGLALLSHFKWS